MKSLRYDIAIIGAGGAGMHLLLSLHKQKLLAQKKVLIIDPDPKDFNDRTWCFWSKPGDPITIDLQPVISHSWDKMDTPAGVRSIAPLQYHHVRSADFYGYVKSTLKDYKNITWIQDEVRNVERYDQMKIYTTRLTYEADRVFDSRPTPPQLKSFNEEHNKLWQSFVGYRIKLKQKLDSPFTMHLMNFEIDQQDSCQFMYVLPISDEECLVELTRFGTELLHESAAHPILKAWINDNLGEYTSLEKEINKIPMSLNLGPSDEEALDENYHLVGTAGGAIKATTGYAFKTMHHHANQIADALSKNQRIPSIRRKSRLAFYDRLLIHILKNKPEKGSMIFTRLFQKVAPARVFSFLDENPTPVSEFKILSTLPPKPFLEAIWKEYVVPKKQRFQVKNLKPASTKLFILLVGISLLAIQAVNPAVSSTISKWLFVGGLIFPGIPHGALDHVTGHHRFQDLRKMSVFILRYVALMAGIAGIWIINPLIGLIAFIVYSAWHFGESDLVEWGAFKPTRALFYGMGVLLFILGSHWTEMSYYVQSFGITQFSIFDKEIGLMVAIFSAIPILAVLPSVRSDKIASWLGTVLLLIIGVFLPLVAAFGLYFIGHHSINGWKHIQKKYNYSFQKMVSQALPFSLMAYVTLAVFWIALELLSYPISGFLPIIFAFIAAISAPHIWFMHKFYTEKA